MDSNTTNLFDVDEVNEVVIKDTIKEVYESLEERHHNPINQLVGYIMSGDPGYISSHMEARNKISKLDRTKIIEVLVRNFIKNMK